VFRAYRQDLCGVKAARTLGRALAVALTRMAQCITARNTSYLRLDNRYHILLAGNKPLCIILTQAIATVAAFTAFIHYLRIAQDSDVDDFGILQSFARVPPREL
jgi:formiminotetrahydrofolate cyclodeaminase